MRVVHLLLLTFAFLSFSRFALSQEPATAVEPVTVILVRHGDTDSSNPVPDPELTERGVQRAEALASLLSAAGVTHLFSTEFVRTRTTLDPLAKRTGVEVEVIPAREGARQLQLLRALPAGSVAVVAGHSNTVPGMARALGTQPLGLEQHERYGEILPHDAFDRAYVITLPVSESAGPKLVELRY